MERRLRTELRLDSKLFLDSEKILLVECFYDSLDIVLDHCAGLFRLSGLDRSRPDHFIFRYIVQLDLCGVDIIAPDAAAAVGTGPRGSHMRAKDAENRHRIIARAY